MIAPRILCVRFSAIGDCVMAAYAVTALRETFPDAELAWAIEDTCEPLVDTNQLVNKVFVTDRAEWRKARGSLKTISATYRAMIKVRTFRPQIGFDFQGHLKTAICLRLSGARTRLSWGATDSVSRNFNRLVPPSPESIHMVEKHFGLINSWKPCERPQFPLIPKVKSAIGTGHVSIQTGSGGLGKSYPIKQWDVVAQTLRSEGYRVVYIGGPSDPQPCGELDNFVGKLSLRESMGVIASSALHLAGDTGTGHIAAAYGTPGVSIFGPMPSSVYRPFSPKTVVLERGGRPENITTDEVIEAALNQLRRFS